MQWNTDVGENIAPPPDEGAIDPCEPHGEGEGVSNTANPPAPSKTSGVGRLRGFQEVLDEIWDTAESPNFGAALQVSRQRRRKEGGPSIPWVHECARKGVDTHMHTYGEALCTMTPDNFYRQFSIHQEALAVVDHLTSF